jgi:hypothetical protein
LLFEAMEGLDLKKEEKNNKTNKKNNNYAPLVSSPYNEIVKKVREKRKTAIAETINAFETFTSKTLLGAGLILI